MKEYESKIMELSAKGLSREEIVTNLCAVNPNSPTEISPELFNSIKENITEFNELVEKYQELAYAWWQAQGRRFVIEMTGVGVEKLNFQAWYAVMKNRFGWTDLRKLSMDGELRIRLTDDEREERINRLKQMVSEN